MAGVAPGQRRRRQAGRCQLPPGWRRGHGEGPNTFAARANLAWEGIKRGKIHIFDLAVAEDTNARAIALSIEREVIAKLWTWGPRVSKDDDPPSDAPWIITRQCTPYPIGANNVTTGWRNDPRIVVGVTAVSRKWLEEHWVEDNDAPHDS